MYISGRERKIIEFLLESKEEVTIKEIADSLEVSTRTVHRDLKSVEDILAKYQLGLNKKSGVGIQLIGDEEQKHQLELALFTVEHTDYTPEERQAIIVSTLLESNEPMKLFTLANELQVTIATVSNDLDRMEEQFSEFDLELVRKRGYGVKVVGKEKNKRAALSYLISQHMDEYDFIHLLKENIEKKSKQQLDTISNRLLGIVDRNRLIIIEKSVEKVSKKLPYELADSSHIGLVVHLALAIERLNKGENIQFDPNYLHDLQETKEYDIARELIYNLEQALQMKIPDDEIGYITMHLMGAKLRYDHDYLLEESSLNVAYKAKELISHVGANISEELDDHPALLNDLVAHLKPTIYRLQQGMSIKNPLLKEIKEDYQGLFSLVEDGVKKVFPETKFPDEEIGYLVLHFASSILRQDSETDIRALVICSSGIGTSKILASRLLQQIPEIKHVDNRSLFEMNTIDLANYDLIVSTVALKDVDVKYVLASPMLTNPEVEKIKKHLRLMKIRHRPEKNKRDKSIGENRVGEEAVISRLQLMQEYSKVTLELLLHFQVQVIKEAESMAEALEQVCLALEKDQTLNSAATVIQAILAREKLGGVGIPNTSLVLYHTRSETARRVSFTVATLPKAFTVTGMDGNEMQVETILLMLAPLETSEASLEILSFISGLMIKDQLSTTIFGSKDETKISQFLSGELNEFINKKISIRSDQL
ncbi:BglG family transcription antiterminator [Aquibacillus salsiterrae]|uniref:BglG family transcription antiterminator n=1 Tax=Aquibacillus salsiterrae TaxID=2950439 RepID=A0A9X3WCG3_9BACI|nr:PRD domain-containing protein [Aquibacillus salsiterrae]MDC3416922.1 BglG family transcription antiterminator [Aquibacillus salsiterrae]